MKYAYIRYKQHDIKRKEYQEQILNVTRKDIIVVREAAGIDDKKKELEILLTKLKKGDILMFADFAVVSRTARNLYRFITALLDKGVLVYVPEEAFSTDKEENYADTLAVIKSLAQMETEAITENKNLIRGVTTSGRPVKEVDNDKLENMIILYKAKKITGVKMAKELGISRNKLYSILYDRGIIKKK